MCTSSGERYKSITRNIYIAHVREKQERDKQERINDMKEYNIKMKNLGRRDGGVQLNKEKGIQEAGRGQEHVLGKSMGIEVTSGDRCLQPWEPTTGTIRLVCNIL